MEKQQQRKDRKFSRPPTVDSVPVSTRVVNLSSSTLTRPELRLLDKGLKYVPSSSTLTRPELGFLDKGLKYVLTPQKLTRWSL